MSCTPNVVETKVVYVSSGPVGPQGATPSPSFANVYISGNEVETIFSQTETYYPVVGTKQEKILSSDWVLSGGKMKYIGTQPITGLILCTLCLSMDTSNSEIRARIAVNDVPQATTCAQTSITGSSHSGRKESLSMQTLHTLQSGDELDIYLGDWTSTSPVTVRNLQLTFYGFL